MKRSIQTLALTALMMLAFTSMSQQRSLGMKVDREKAENVPLIDKPLGFGENLPKAVSLKKYVPKIGDQGDHGTCVGWSSTYCLATMEYAIQRGVTNKVELEYSVYDPYYTYLSIVDAESYNSCGDGTYVEDACELLKEKGAKRKLMDQLACGDDLAGHVADNSVLEFTEFHRLYSWYDDMEENVEAVCQSLADNHPVVIGAYLPSSFFDIGDDGRFKPTKYQQENPVGTAVGGHAMCIVGYDDDKFGGCFTVVNSWGDEWGDNGFLYITYDDYQAFGQSAYSFETKLKEPYSVSLGTVYGSTYSGYGIERLKGGGVFEGEFKNGEMHEGVYFNHNKKLFKGGKLFMKKMVKKHYGDLIYEGGETKRPIGFILNK